MPKIEEKPSDQKLSGILTFIKLPIRFTAKRAQIPCAAVKSVHNRNFLFFKSNTVCAINKSPNRIIKMTFPESKISLLVFSIYVLNFDWKYTANYNFFLSQILIDYLIKLC